MFEINRPKMLYLPINTGSAGDTASNKPATKLPKIKDFRLKTCKYQKYRLSLQA